MPKPEGLHRLAEGARRARGYLETSIADRLQLIAASGVGANSQLALGGLGIARSQPRPCLGDGARCLPEGPLAGGQGIGEGERLKLGLDLST